jgi:hypothetical protein
MHDPGLDLNRLFTARHAVERRLNQPSVDQEWIGIMGIIG